MTQRAPSPKELIGVLRSLILVLDVHGDRAIEMAGLLAARGWPASTMGTGSRGNSELTSVEAAVDRPGEWADVDLDLAKALHDVWTRGLDARTLIAHVVSHAAPDDRQTNRQPGSGDCLVCDRYCAGTATDRLRGGYCDSCRKAWDRYRAKAGKTADRASYRRVRRAELDSAVRDQKRVAAP